jgi:dipeptidyl aminopeptidase/acylaminoacyl peptidase
MALTKAQVSLLFVCASAALAAPPRMDFAETARATRQYYETAVSPDGRRVAWVEGLPADKDHGSAGSAIFVADLDGRDPRRVTAGSTARMEGSVAWSPDGERIAFLSDAGQAGQRQVYEASWRGGPARKLTAIEGHPVQPRWSPDGRTLALLVIEGTAHHAGPYAATTHETGEIREVYFEQRLALVDEASLALRLASPADTYVYEYAWAPDSRKLAVVAAQGNGDNNWYLARLQVLDAATGDMKVLYRPSWQIAQPVWSPDGGTIAFLHGLMSDQGMDGGSVYAVPAAGGPATDLTPGLKATPNALAWPRRDRLLFTEYLGGGMAMVALDPATGRTETLHQGAESFWSAWAGSPSLSRDGQVSAVVRSSFTQPPEIWTGPAGAWRQATRANAALTPAWGQVRSLGWRNGDWDCQGWLVYPRDYDPARTYPMVVCVHGGPAGLNLAEWPYPDSSEHPLSEAGFFLFYPNPRGSFGQGQAFTRANIRDFGYGDLDDIMAGVDEALRAAPIDPRRLGISGWSYGGYMAMWAVTQTGRFKAALAGAGLADLQSYYGENKIDQWLIPYFGRSVYEDPYIYLRSSPITFIRNAKTPTLVVVGDSDAECPAPQSYEFWHALKTLGVETTLVVYPNEGHGMADPANLKDLRERTLAWFTSHLGRPDTASR